MTAQTSELTREQHHLLIDRFSADLRQRGYENIHHRYAATPPRCLMAGDTPCPDHAGEPVRPDIYAEKDDRRFIFEIELAETLEGRDTLDHLQTLSRCAGKNDLYFYLVVPEEIREDANRVMESLEERDRRRMFVMSL